MLKNVLGFFGLSSSFLLGHFMAVGQVPGPSALQYPQPPVYFANESSIYLSPSVSGNVDHYSIDPAGLPAGLSFDPNTGVLSGLPVESTRNNQQINYTVTAHG